ncbi:hypothetical protein [Mucilaginibacter polytrichastri]|uniref:Uncharacterized protein n=1 Tax=Mucilaginibacter polytrichastri TaxID=1302689 RepID=A0A1Q6A5F2_9SPHI|nr:hypothetical protein [Mucilaginibacter polytrichastri]OKS89239.1 hypothetical protein RG47T_4722 [Mucilaginibacter polytrichastri]SFS98510.1 hypothetical protein SAMN04487890_107280 [Mucilaginibacter polytrichastri]
MITTLEELNQKIDELKAKRNVSKVIITTHDNFYKIDAYYIGAVMIPGKIIVDPKTRNAVLMRGPILVESFEIRKHIIKVSEGDLNKELLLSEYTFSS